jgi:hypothetical protein
MNYKGKYNNKDESKDKFCRQVKEWSNNYDAEALPRAEIWEDLAYAGRAMIHGGVNGTDLADVLDGIKAKSNGQFPLFVNCLVQKVREAPIKMGGSELFEADMAQCMAFARQAHSFYSREVSTADKVLLSLAAMKNIPDHAGFEKVVASAMKSNDPKYDQAHTNGTNDVYRGGGGKVRRHKTVKVDE